MEFQSTLPARGATQVAKNEVARNEFQSTLPARGATGGGVLLVSLEIFQSTLPARGATWMVNFVRHNLCISIHAPRTGSDRESRAVLVQMSFQSTLPARGATILFFSSKAAFFHFNPRSPHGERLFYIPTAIQSTAFQSTLPARGATSASGISTSDSTYFNPRSPHGERRASFCN